MTDLQNTIVMPDPQNTHRESGGWSVEISQNIYRAEVTDIDLTIKNAEGLEEGELKKTGLLQHRPETLHARLIK